MSEVPEHLLYTDEHEWVLIKGEVGVVGITDYAQETLDDIVYVELPELGAAVRQNEQFGAVDSSKTSSELFAPISGEVIEINDDLDPNPQLVNQDPYGKGWMIKIKIADPSDSERLMDASAYREFLETVQSAEE